MLNVNEVRLIGHLGTDPEIIKYGEGQLLKLSLGTNDFKKNVHWHNIIVFGEKQIEFINNHAKKGSSLYVEGELTYKVKDQVKYTSVVVSQYHNIILLDTKTTDTETKDTTTDQDDDYDDIPF